MFQAADSVPNHFGNFNHCHETKHSKKEVTFCMCGKQQPQPDEPGLCHYADLSRHDSKSLDDVKQYAPFDAVVTMGCGDACPWMPAKQFIDWQIPDPKHMEPEEFNKVRDYIKEKVGELLKLV
jgi:hypothetical protein